LTLSFRLPGLAGSSIYLSCLLFLDQSRSRTIFSPNVTNKRIKLKTPDVCPVCGEDVPSGALACPECGADHNSGWREGAASYDALDLPDEDFSYNEFVRQEFGSSAKPAGISLLWWITALLLIVVSVAIYFFAAR